MSRAFYRLATLLAAPGFAIAFAMIAVSGPAPRLLWNSSASAPVGLYLVHVGARARRGAFVAVMPPPRLAAFMVRRRYLGENVPLLKRVAATAGARVCNAQGIISINGIARSIAHARDREGRALPGWVGCRTLERGELFLLNAPADSFDSRYFGPLSSRTVIGIATPILTRAAPDAPWRWRRDATAQTDEEKNRCISVNSAR
ncbi:S26 family signal peptidase [Sphingobium yanoikuyae]|uniref:S26 family signal peptidase n=1 Tax=Sphingobium yanoikuyae TaxID=13690 RepID=A0AA42WXY1_SPHYA|nr:S26 family signal peptidase [Sphingobium yanoikuyae]MDH2132753.1 S26 family signal peptidase [Sphingobium yanoikuyae]MDH2149374.1 S26 family signal peptidase [Sphingobium yanoikuyae]MDH2168166.1 S26 family signal peptidase [Sphingobium yanoikuyae]